MRIPLMVIGSLVAVLALSGCAKGDKGDKGDPGATGAAGPPGPAGPSGKDGRDGASPPPQFRVVRGEIDGGVVKPATCGAEEIMVSATCMVKAGETAETPRTIGETGASCDVQPNQSNPPQAVILCAKR